MAGPLYDILPTGEASSDELLGRFLDYVAGKRLTLYPAQEEALRLHLPDQGARHADVRLLRAKPASARWSVDLPMSVFGGTLYAPMGTKRTVFVMRS